MLLNRQREQTLPAGHESHAAASATVALDSSCPPRAFLRTRRLAARCDHLAGNTDWCGERDTRGSVIPGPSAAQIHFEFSPDPELAGATSTAEQSVAAGDAPQAVDVGLTNLNQATTYYLPSSRRTTRELSGAMSSLSIRVLRTKRCADSLKRQQRCR